MVRIKNFFKWIETILGAITFGGIAIWHILICISVIIIFITMGIAMFLPEHTEEKKEDLGGIQEMYEDGRKTIQSFGNKRFAIMKGIWNGKTTWCLFDREKNGVEGTLDYIENYKRLSPYVYAKGEKGYTKLNYETAELVQSKDINNFSREDQNIFEGL